MFLNSDQIQEITNLFSQIGLNKAEFNYTNSDKEFAYFKISDPETYRYQIRTSIQGARFGDVFCTPYTVDPSIFKSCDSFQECLRLGSDWATKTKYQLLGKPYYHKVFISHSSEDKNLIDDFVDKILRLSCGLNTTDIIYTSRQTTGVELGDNIPEYIKTNLQTCSLVLFMISPNYRKSEVCLNEMGAAWALNKKTISILLPGVSFNSLGWLTSLDKAIKIDDPEGLDKLASTLCRKNLDITDWNRQKELFINTCSKRTLPLTSNNTAEEIGINIDNSIRVFDTRFLVRTISEGEYQYQLDMRIHANDDIVLKSVHLVNDNDFVGPWMNPERYVKLTGFIPMEHLDINAIPNSQYEEIVTKAIEEVGVKIIDTKIAKGEQKSISFVGGIYTTREPDGNADLPIKNWKINLLYNIEDEVSIPIEAEIAKGNVNGYFWIN